MNSFPLICILLVLAVSRQSHGESYFEQIIYNRSEPRNSLACFKTATLTLFQNFKEVVDKYCIQSGENEFKSNIIVRTKSYDLIMKNGPYQAQFEEGMKQAEKIGTKTIDGIQYCLSLNCSFEKRKDIKNFVNIFRSSIRKCGNSNYLSRAAVALEQTCANIKGNTILDAPQVLHRSAERSYNRQTIDYMNEEWNAGNMLPDYGER